jgi:3-oxoacyl-[acyl-carrier-protein] synthase II
MNRPVVTAAGVVSALGQGLESFACALYGGRCAAGPSAAFPDFRTAEVSPFEPQRWLGNKGIRVLDRSARLLAVAGAMALADSGVHAEAPGPAVGLVCGTVFGSLHSIAAFDWSGLTEGPTLVNPTEFANTVISAPAGQAAIRHNLRGVNSTICAGLASGLHAIHYAADFIRFGRAEALLCGGVEELCEESLLGFPSVAGGPAAAHGGPPSIVIGEGCALWMCEDGHSVVARGGIPWLEICGFGSTQSASDPQGFDRTGAGAAEAIRRAIAASGIGPGDIACVVASANGSDAGDEMEAAALDAVFGPALHRVPVCAPKSAFGEAMGASGALCSVVAGLALLKQSAPPTVEMAATARLPLSAHPAPVSGEYALVNAFGCGGCNASLVLRLWNN